VVSLTSRSVARAALGLVSNGALALFSTACTEPGDSARPGSAVLVVEGADVRACEAALRVEGGELEGAPSDAVRIEIVRREARVGIAATAKDDHRLESLPLRWRGAPGRIVVERATCFDRRGVAVAGASLRLENRTS
jgi:hypothetical protein